MPYVSLLQSRKHNFFTDGGRELFDCAGQGRIDVFFLSGGEIDGEGNINLVAIGDYDKPQVRFPGSFGSAHLYYVVPKVVLFRTEHSRRTLVPRVSFISAPGGSPANVYRPGGPIALVTNRCLFRFDRERRRFRLESVHPGHTVEEVADHTGFAYDCPARRADHAGAQRSDARHAAAGHRAPARRSLSAVRRGAVRCERSRGMTKTTPSHISVNGPDRFARWAKAILESFETSYGPAKIDIDRTPVMRRNCVWPVSM